MPAQRASETPRRSPWICLTSTASHTGRGKDDVVDVGAGERQVAHHPVHPRGCRAARRLRHPRSSGPAEPARSHRRGPVRHQRPGRCCSYDPEHGGPRHRMPGLENSQPDHQQAEAREQQGPEPAMRAPRRAPPARSCRSSQVARRSPLRSSGSRSSPWPRRSRTQPICAGSTRRRGGCSRTSSRTSPAGAAAHSFTKAAASCQKSAPSPCSGRRLSDRLVRRTGPRQYWEKVAPRHLPGGRLSSLELRHRPDVAVTPFERLQR